MTVVRAKKSSGVVVPQSLRWPGRVTAAMIFMAIRSVAATVRFHWDDRSGLFAGVPHQPVIFCIWHNRLAFCLILYEHVKQLRHSQSRMAAMVSASKDGAILARVLEHFDVQPVRGSTSRRGPQALLELTSWAEQGYDLAITPDGPRGPRYVVQEGIIALAQFTGLPIVPVAYHLDWKYCLKSWDAFQVPIFFSRCQAILGQPFYVPKELEDDQREIARRALNERMMAITVD